MKDKHTEGRKNNKVYPNMSIIIINENSWMFYRYIKNTQGDETKWKEIATSSKYYQQNADVPILVLDKIDFKKAKKKKEREKSLHNKKDQFTKKW